jgi:hypothetical protein
MGEWALMIGDVVGLLVALALVYVGKGLRR